MTSYQLRASESLKWADFALLWSEKIQVREFEWRENVTELWRVAYRLMSKFSFIQNLATRIETEMRKLDRLAKQLANIEEIDVRFLKGIRRLTTTILQDAKIQIVTNK